MTLVQPVVAPFKAKDAYPLGSTHTGVIRSGTSSQGYRTTFGGGGTSKVDPKSPIPVRYDTGAEGRGALKHRAGGRCRMIRTITEREDRRLMVAPGELNVTGCTRAELHDSLVRYEAKFGPIQPKPRSRVSNARMLGGRR